MAKEPEMPKTPEEIKSLDQKLKKGEKISKQELEEAQLHLDKFVKNLGEYEKQAIAEVDDPLRGDIDREEVKAKVQKLHESVENYRLKIEQAKSRLDGSIHSSEMDTLNEVEKQAIAEAHENATDSKANLEKKYVETFKSVPEDSVQGIKIHETVLPVYKQGAPQENWTIERSETYVKEADAATKAIEGMENEALAADKIRIENGGTYMAEKGALLVARILGNENFTKAAAELTARLEKLGEPDEKQNTTEAQEKYKAELSKILGDHKVAYAKFEQEVKDENNRKEMVKNSTKLLDETTKQIAKIKMPNLFDYSQKKAVKALKDIKIPAESSVADCLAYNAQTLAISTQFAMESAKERDEYAKAQDVLKGEKALYKKATDKYVELATMLAGKSLFTLSDRQKDLAKKYGGKLQGIGAPKPEPAILVESAESYEKTYKQLVDEVETPFKVGLEVVQFKDAGNSNLADLYQKYLDTKAVPTQTEIDGAKQKDVNAHWESDETPEQKAEAKKQMAEAIGRLNIAIAAEKFINESTPLLAKLGDLFKTEKQGVANVDKEKELDEDLNKVNELLAKSEELGGRPEMPEIQVNTAELKERIAQANKREERAEREKRRVAAARKKAAEEKKVREEEEKRRDEEDPRTAEDRMA